MDTEEVIQLRRELEDALRRIKDLEDTIRDAVYNLNYIL